MDVGDVDVDGMEKLRMCLRFQQVPVLKAGKQKLAIRLKLWVWMLVMDVQNVLEPISR